MLVLFAFIGLFIVTSIFFVAIYGLQIHGPYSQLNPVKWLANVSGVALIIGSILLLKTRMNKPDQVSAYKDWLLLGLVLGLGVTGMGAQLTRLAGWAAPVLRHLLYPPDPGLVHLRLPAVLEARAPGLPHGGHDLRGVRRSQVSARISA